MVLTNESWPHILAATWKLKAVQPTEGVLAISWARYHSLAWRRTRHGTIRYAGASPGWLETVHEPDPPKRDFFHHQVLAADFDQADTDAIFAMGSEFRSHAELAEEETD